MKIYNMSLFYETNKISCGINVENKQILEMRTEKREKGLCGVGLGRDRICRKTK